MTSFRNIHRIIILGGGYAGLTAAQRLSHLSKDIAITLVDAKPAFEERIRLHQVATGVRIASFPYQNFLNGLGITFVHAKTTTLLPCDNQVILKDHLGKESILTYDYLIYALGSQIDSSTVPGASDHAYLLDSAGSATRLFQAIKRAPESNVLVVGGGLTGIETAAELKETFPNVKVALATPESFTANKTPAGFSEKAIDYLNRAFTERNIDIIPDARISEISAGNAITKTGDYISFDTCIWTAGFKPSSLAEQAGMEVNNKGQIKVDRSLRSISHPNIIAIGDAANANTPNAGTCRMGSATALAMGAAGAKTLAALLKQKSPPPFRFVYLFRNICLGRHDGVVQFVDRRDVPRDFIWTGKRAAAWKEYICESTLSTIGLKHPGKLPALPPLQTLPQLLQGMRQYS